MGRGMQIRKQEDKIRRDFEKIVIRENSRHIVVPSGYERSSPNSMSFPRMRLDVVDKAEIIYAMKPEGADAVLTYPSSDWERTNVIFLRRKQC